MAKKKAVKKKKAKKKNNEIKGAHVVLHRLLKAGIDCPDCKRKSKNYIRAVLLCKRTQDAPTHPGYWALFGGKLKENEPPQEAALREVAEELAVIGIDGKELTEEKLHEILEIEELRNVPISRREGTLSIQYFRSPLEYNMDKLRLKPNENGKVEGEGLGWFTAEEIHHLMMRPEDRIAIAEFFKRNGV